MLNRYSIGLVILIVCLLTTIACFKTQDAPLLPQVLEPSEDRNGCHVSTPPDDLKVKDFYSKYCDAFGIPILASDQVEDRALQQTYYIINNMLAPIPEVRQRLVSRGYYVALIGLLEELTDLPEYSHMSSQYWNWRAKGLGGTKRVRITSAAEENMLCFRRDRYYQENILIHEFAHTIHLAGLGRDYNEFNQELETHYQSALDSGLWENTYAGDNHLEYWAEGLQDYFNANIENKLGDGVHNQINTREELADYDPALYQFIEDLFHGFNWTPTCPRAENTSGVSTKSGDD